MTSGAKALSLLNAAEEDLRQVVQSLTRAQPAEVDSARHLLEKLVAVTSEVESSARRDPHLPLRDALLYFRATLAGAERSASIALAILGRQISLAGLNPAESEASVRFEG